MKRLNSNTRFCSMVRRSSSDTCVRHTERRATSGRTQSQNDSHSTRNRAHIGSASGSSLPLPLDATSLAALRTIIDLRDATTELFSTVTAAAGRSVCVPKMIRKWFIILQIGAFGEVRGEEQGGGGTGGGHSQGRHPRPVSYTHLTLPTTPYV